MMWRILMSSCSLDTGFTFEPQQEADELLRHITRWKAMIPVLCPQHDSV
jgi:hypothetical protein